MTIVGRCALEKRKDFHPAGSVSKPPAPAAQGTETHIACQYSPSQSKPAHFDRKEAKSSQRFPSPRMIRSSASTSTALSTITRLPFNATTSLRTRNPMSPCRRCAQSRLQKALRYDPQLYLFAETTTLDQCRRSQGGCHSDCQYRCPYQQSATFPDTSQGGLRRMRTV